MREWNNYKVFCAIFCVIAITVIITRSCNAAEVVTLEPGQADTTIVCEDFLIKPAIPPCTTKVKGVFDKTPKSANGFGMLVTPFRLPEPNIATICDTVIVKAVWPDMLPGVVDTMTETPRYECKKHWREFTIYSTPNEDIQIYERGRLVIKGDNVFPNILKFQVDCTHPECAPKPTSITMTFLHNDTALYIRGQSGNWYKATEELDRLVWLKTDEIKGDRSDACIEINRHEGTTGIYVYSPVQGLKVRGYDMPPIESKPCKCCGRK